MDSTFDINQIDNVNGPIYIYNQSIDDSLKSNESFNIDNSFSSPLHIKNLNSPIPRSLLNLNCSSTPQISPIRRGISDLSKSCKQEPYAFNSTYSQNMLNSNHNSYNSIPSHKRHRSLSSPNFPSPHIFSPSARSQSPTPATYLVDSFKDKVDGSKSIVRKLSRATLGKIIHKSSRSPSPGPITRRSSSLSTKEYSDHDSSNCSQSSTTQSYFTDISSNTIYNEELHGSFFDFSDSSTNIDYSPPPISSTSLNCKNTDNNTTSLNNSTFINKPSTLQDLNCNFIIPEELKEGISFLKVTRKKKVQKVFKLDEVNGLLVWNNKSSSRLKIDNIKDIRVAKDARNYREEFKISSEYSDRWITIIYLTDNSQLKVIHLVAISNDVFKMFVSTLQALLKHRVDLMGGIASSGENITSIHWTNFVVKDKDGEERLGFEGVERLARKLHVHCSKRFLWEKFVQADVDHSGYLNFSEFRIFVKLLKTRSELMTIFNFTINNYKNMIQIPTFDSFSQSPTIAHYSYNGTDSLMSLNCFKYFVQKVQHQNVDEKTIEKIFSKYSCENNKGISFESFSDFLSSSYSKLIKENLSNDLSRPLNEYYISSSHNTYLLGRQFAGMSSVEGYIRVLQQGCRCVEIDCWNGDLEPIVNHGRTFTSDILFSDVIDAVGKYAFISSPYPLIISLEVRCNVSQQMKMVDILKQSLGDKLVTEPIKMGFTQLPSPIELKHRILLKVKKYEENYANSSSTLNSTDSSATSESQGEESTNITDNFTSLNNGHTHLYGRDRKKKGGSVIKQLSDLCIYVQGIKFRNFSLPESKTITHCFSFSERMFNSTYCDKEKRAQMEKHNTRYLMRIYPSGFRVSSSNFDPLLCWRLGAQMVAMNFQTYDLGLQLNDALFASADNSGYVLKPKELRNSIFTNSLRDTSSHPIPLYVNMISGQQLPRVGDNRYKDPYNPRVEIEYLAPGIQPQKYSTGVIKDNGFNPIWDEKFTFSMNRPLFELSFIRFTIYNNDSLIATYSGRISTMNQGYRHIPLYDTQGEEYIFSTLFVHISLNT